MTARARALLVPLVLLLALAAPAAAQDALGRDVADEPIIVTPRGPQYGFRDPDDPDRFVWVFMDGVEVEQGARRLTGDALVLVVRFGDVLEEEDEAEQMPAAPEGGLSVMGTTVLEVYLDGDVELYEGDQRVLAAQSYFEDRLLGVARVLHGELRVEMAAQMPDAPLLVRYEAMRMLPDGTIEADGVVYTNCELQEPHWHVRAPWLRVALEEEGRVLRTGANTAHVADTPMLWWPGYRVNLDRERAFPWRDLDFGSSSRFGTELVALWGGDFTPVLEEGLALFGYDGLVDAEWEATTALFSKRGFFTELLLDYRTDNSRGHVLTSYIKDNAEEDELGVDIEDDTRGRIKVQHRTELDENRVVDVELSYISDRGFLREYYEDEARQGKVQESYVDYRDYRDDEVVSVLMRGRLNDFQTQVEYLPEIERRVAGRQASFQILGHDAFVTSRDFVSHARLAPDEDDATLDSERNLRFGRRTRIDVPVDFGNGDRVDFFGTLDLTGFERSVDDGSTGRYAAGGGAVWARTYSSVDQGARNERWNIDGLRHVVEPYVGFDSVFGRNKEPDELIQIDDVETVDRFRTFTVGVRDRWQTHQGGRVRTVLDTDLQLAMFPNEERDNDGDTLGLFKIDTVWQPGANIPFFENARTQWRADYDITNGRVDESDLRFKNRFDPDTRYEVRHTRVDRGAGGGRDVDFLTVAAQRPVAHRWLGAAFVQYDIEESETSRSAIVLRQTAHRWYIDYSAEFRRGRNVDDGDSDDEFRFSIRFAPIFTKEEELLDEIGVPRRPRR